MLVIAIKPKTEKDPKKYIIEATEEELDTVSGIAQVEHIAGRINVGDEIKVAEVYKQLDDFVANKEKMQNAEKTLRKTADSIKNLLN